MEIIFFVYFRVLVIRKALNSLTKFLGVFYEGYWIPTSGCKRLLVQLLPHSKRFLLLCSVIITFLSLDISLDSNDCLIYHQEAAEKLAPHLEIILQHLMCAFGKYQVVFWPFHVLALLNMIMMRHDSGWLHVEANIMFVSLQLHFILIIPLVHKFIPWFDYIQRRNLRIVYDAIATLADAVGEKLNQVL